MKTEIFAISNQKGGVGKTTTTVNLATALSTLNKKILVIDLDAQGNATVSFGQKRVLGGASSYSVITGQYPIQSAIQKTMVPNLYLLPASQELLGVDLELANVQNPQFFLKKSLEQVSDFDYIFIDCPPAVGMLTLNALVAATKVIIPIQCEYLALEGVADLMKTINRIKQNFNSNLKIQGVVLTMYDARFNLAKSIQNDVRSFFGDLVFKTIIPRNVRIPEAPSHGKPVMLYDFKSIGAQSYIHLAAEVLQREKGENHG